ncbi:hypothetical protein Ddye_019902 [Dipteronia dyeriana]|uniref:Uncharacterized protein n=1 Tax=Dipteronia dyeriana TaxID=168575 RepID=A0AAD9TYY4_9ROSI|nr:hypothetical protein Ddye_019902 [Dipteronia dyeriana]
MPVDLHGVDCDGGNAPTAFKMVHAIRKRIKTVVNKFDTSTLSIKLQGKPFKLDPSIFSHVMGISDRGDRISIVEAIHDSWRTKFSITNHDIKLLHLDDLLKNNKTADDDFKVSINEYTPPAAHGDNSDKEKADIPNDDRIHLVLKEI